MKRFSMSIMIGGVLLALATPSFGEGRIRQRQANQQSRIGQGAQNGSLTPRETARLGSQQARLNRSIRRDRIDGGGLTPGERAKIEHRQDRMSREIYRQKHDGQTR